MEEISKFFEKYKNFFLKEEEKKEIIKEVVFELTNISVLDHEIKIKNKTIYLKVKNIIKNQIFFKKEEIIKKIKEKSKNKYIFIDII